MSATLTISVVHPGTPVDAKYNVILRVRPSRGRAVERCLSLRGAEELVIDPGEVSVDALLSSGQTRTWTLSLSDGEVKDIQIEIPQSPHETMQWLSLSRDPAAPTRPRPVPESSQALDKMGFVNARQPIAVETMAHRDRGYVNVISDNAYSEGRILHVLDTRQVEVFLEPGDSALAFLKLQQPTRPETCRISALPGPWLGRRFAPEVHVALRDMEGDVLPDVQVVPANEDLASVVGFLERYDQRALSVLRKDFVERAVQYMFDKRRDPLAAAVGLALLLRLGELDEVRGWSENLWRWFPALPDGGALHAAVLLRNPKDTNDWRDEFRAATLGSVRTGLPFLSDSLRCLRQASGVLQEFDDSPEAAGARSWCDRLVRSLDADAVFATVTINTGQLEWIWGAPIAPGGTP